MDETIQVIKEDIDINIFGDYRHYLNQNEVQDEYLVAATAGKNNFINTPAELEAFDHYLSVHEDKADLFVSFFFLVFSLLI